MASTRGAHQRATCVATQQRSTVSAAFRGVVRSELFGRAFHIVPCVCVTVRVVVVLRASCAERVAA
eukprot:8562703-Lingulodinium_polyedra.AAC.1